MRAVCDWLAEKFHARKMQKDLKRKKLGLLMRASYVCD